MIDAKEFFQITTNGNKEMTPPQLYLKKCNIIITFTVTTQTSKFDESENVNRLK